MSEKPKSWLVAKAAAEKACWRGIPKSPKSSAPILTQNGGLSGAIEASCESSAPSPVSILAQNSSLSGDAIDIGDSSPVSEEDDGFDEAFQEVSAEVEQMKREKFNWPKVSSPLRGEIDPEQIVPEFKPLNVADIDDSGYVSQEDDGFDELFDETDEIQRQNSSGRKSLHR
jgi:hypothetical protein